MAFSIENTTGVITRAAPSLAKSAETRLPSTNMSVNSLLPFPPAILAIRRAQDSKRPSSSYARDIIIIATKVTVGFQTIFKTSIRSEYVTRPRRNDARAPRIA